MPPLSKKLKIENPPSKQSSNVNNELESFQNEIRKIKGLTESIASEESSNAIQYEHDYRLVEDPLEETQAGSNDDIKKYIREQIELSEQRIHQRFDLIEQKLNSFLDRQVAQPVAGSEAVEEWIEQEGSLQKDVAGEVDSRIFPIADEDTFDWFFEQLRNEEYRNALISNRWPLARNVSTKSFNVSVKEFLRMHFELPVCVKYSVSGFGAHGMKKRKLESNTLTSFVYECFSIPFPGLHSFQETSKAIVQFWGRAPDCLNKANDRAIKREYTKTITG